LVTEKQEATAFQGVVAHFTYLPAQFRILTGTAQELGGILDTIANFDGVGSQQLGNLY
jgi:hypothetical protein